LSATPIYTLFPYTTLFRSPMDDEQKSALLSFVRDDGKGVVGGHSAIDTFYKWAEFGEMMGAYFDEHPWGQFQAPVIVEVGAHHLDRKSTRLNSSHVAISYA